MPELANNKQCCGCGACENVCPQSCIEMRRNGEGFLYPTVNVDKCIGCGMCEKSCPVLNTETNPPSIVKAAYAAFTIDEEVRLESSSGGIFSELAEYVLKNGGVVFGCAMSEDCKKARHIMIEKPEDIKYLRGSKYLQSEIGRTYKETKEALKQQRLVLYSGTPCQIAGLKAYLGNNTYDNLLTVDVICHGVPSQSVWKNYLYTLENKFSANADTVSFRNKLYGWKNYNLSCSFKNGSEYHGKAGYDLFLKGFVSDYYLRESCCNCKFKGKNIQSDITLGDFWGIDNVLPEINDDKGVSVVLVHSEKGQSAINSISNKIKLFEVSEQNALASNPSFYKSITPNGVRHAFFRDLNKKKPVFKKYCGSTLSSRLIRKFYSVFNKSERED